jgi:multiple sugar transport system permease protein
MARRPVSCSSKSCCRWSRPALILTRTNARTAPVAVVNFMNYEGWEWGKIAAGGSLVMAPVLIFSLAVRRYLVSGLTAGAVKG